MDNISKGMEKIMDMQEYIYNQSVEFFLSNPSMRDEYINDTEISTDDKITDITSLIAFAEEREMYEHCSVLLHMKNKIIEK